MKKTLLALMTLVLVAMAAGCSKDEEQPTETKRLCEIGNTGKAVSAVNYASYSDGSSTRFEENITLQHSSDFTKIDGLEYSEGLPGIMMKDYSYKMNGNTIVDGEGNTAYSDLTFNDKGHIVHLEDYTQPNPNRGVTHASYDVEYNGEGRMTKITFTFRDENGDAVFNWSYDLAWEGGLLQTIKSKHDGEESSTISYTYGSQDNVHRQPTHGIYKELNLLSLAPIRAFVAAGYFGKGSDKFEVASREENHGTQEIREKTYSVELDSEGKIEVLHSTEGEGNHKDFSFTYCNIK